MVPQEQGRVPLCILAGLERPDSGSVIIDGKSLYELSSTDQTIFRNEKIGYVFQNYFLMPDLNAIENVNIPSLIKGDDNLDRAVDLLKKVGLERGSSIGPLSSLEVNNSELQ